MSFYIPYVVGSAGLMLGNYLYNYIYDDSKLETVVVPTLTPNSFYPLPLNKVIVTPSLTPHSLYPLPLNKVIDIEEKYDILKSIEIL